MTWKFTLSICRRFSSTQAAAIFVLVASTHVAGAQATQSLIDRIGTLEGARDPKCYATASRLEDFMYGTPLSDEARFAKNDLQTATVKTVWLAASQISSNKSHEIGASDLIPILNARARIEPFFPLGGWSVKAHDGIPSTISERDKRQYSSIAFGLRAILAAQQASLLSNGGVLPPLSPEAIDVLKQHLDLWALAALQRADLGARLENAVEIDAQAFRAAWLSVVGRDQSLSDVATTPSPTTQRSDFSTLRSIVDQKIEAYAAYNSLSMPVFLRNLQVYFARFRWPSDPEMGTAFRDYFTNTMVQFTSDIYHEADRLAVTRGDVLSRLSDVHEAVTLYLPHEVNEYEDVIYFPNLAGNERVIVEAYDLDAYRDAGIHWLHLEQAINRQDFKAQLELDPFAAELVVEGSAQFGVLVLRIAGKIAQDTKAKSLHLTHLEQSLKTIQARINTNAKTPKSQPATTAAIASASSGSAPSDNVYFTDVTADSGIAFEHRSADWLSRLIRSYSVTDENVARLAIPPAFGGSGVAAEDIDGDGDQDILILSGLGNALFLNDGHGRFSDDTKQAGLRWVRQLDGLPGEPRQPIIADFDNDGHQDIFISYAGDPHRLYRNLGDARFNDVTSTAGLGGINDVAGPATALDFDRDGLLDIYVGSFGDYPHGVLPTLERRNFNGLPNRLLRNKGNMQFEDVTSGSGTANTGWTQAVGHSDLDLDGYQDLIVGNDFGVNAYLRNQGDGTFEDMSAAWGMDKPSYTMNVGLTDLNRDGYPDIYISNIVTFDKDQSYVMPAKGTQMRFDPKTMATMRVLESNDLWVSQSTDNRLTKYDLSNAVNRGASSTGWSWDADFFDFDNDGDVDLYCVNGMNEYAVYSSENPYGIDADGNQRTAIVPASESETNVFFLNQDGRLQNESEASGANLLGNSRSVAYLDLEGDGDLDMVVNNYHGPAVVYRNNMQQADNNWLAIRLVGEPANGTTRETPSAHELS